MTGAVPACRFCAAPLHRMLVDLGAMPLANSFLTEADLARPEPRYPLRVRVCDRCRLVQADESVPPGAIFGDYAYFSSYSDAWLRHARDYAALVRTRFALGSTSRVIEVASNDGYLLKNFVEWGIPCLGIEPAANVAEVARQAGVPTLSLFLGRDTGARIAAEHGAADLVCGANVLAHVPDINDFVAGLRALMKPDAVLTIEFPHLVRLIGERQFDTIYHEHFSYLSLLAVERIFAAHGLSLFDVNRLPTHGGSLRIYAQRTDATASRPLEDGLHRVRALEEAAGVDTNAYYDGFAPRVAATIASVRHFLATAKKADETIVAYGAAAKGNTLLNACGVTRGDIAYVVDRSPHKCGLYLPGSHLPIFAPERVAETRPEWLMILPWNLTDEIVRQMAHIRAWGGRFVTPVPEIREVGAP